MILRWKVSTSVTAFVVKCCRFLILWYRESWSRDPELETEKHFVAIWRRIPEFMYVRILGFRKMPNEHFFLAPLHMRMSTLPRFAIKKLFPSQSWHSFGNVLTSCPISKWKSARNRRYKAWKFGTTDSGNQRAEKSLPRCYANERIIRR